MKRISAKDKLLKYLFYTIIILAVFVTILPILNVVALSLSSSEATMMGKVLIFPVGFNLEAYKAVFQNGLSRLMKGRHL